MFVDKRKCGEDDCRAEGVGGMEVGVVRLPEGKVRWFVVNSSTRCNIVYNNL